MSTQVVQALGYGSRPGSGPRTARRSHRAARQYAGRAAVATGLDRGHRRDLGRRRPHVRPDQRPGLDGRGPGRPGRLADLPVLGRVGHRALHPALAGADTRRTGPTRPPFSHCSHAAARLCSTSSYLGSTLVAALCSPTRPASERLSSCTASRSTSSTRHRRPGAAVPDGASRPRSSSVPGITDAVRAAQRGSVLFLMRGQ